MVETIVRWQTHASGQPLEAAFFGGTFTALPLGVQQSLLQPLQPLLVTGVISSVRISTRPDSIDADTIRRLKSMGVGTVEIGVQSMDDQILARSRRGHTAEECTRAIRCIKAGGLTAGAQLMPGLPGDTAAASYASLQSVIAAGADFLRIYPAVVLAGTELARMYAENCYVPLDLVSGIRICKVLLHEAMTAGIPVIRIGLQADDGLNGDSILAGCWHPSLGQLCRSELYYDLMSNLLQMTAAPAAVTVYCHPRRLSDVIGHGKANMKRLAARGFCVTVQPDCGLAPDGIELAGADGRIPGNLIDDLHYLIT